MSTHKRRNLIVASAILAGLMAVALTHTNVPAEARVQLSECQKRHSYCTERCIMNYGHGKNGFDKANACIKRTCDKQNPGCGYSSGGKGSTGNKPAGDVYTPGGGPIIKPATGGVPAPGGGPIVKPSKGGVPSPGGDPVVKPSKGGVITTGGVPKGGVYSPSSGPKGPAGGSSGPILLRSRR